jgi:2-C-methyl-D-erythritol 2,4-cyclodiphosphate synthase
MSPYIEQMRTHLSRQLQVDLDQINIKATTTEKLGFTGKEEGIACFSVVNLIKVGSKR